ncbi:MAG: DUF420 domain-containing protein [Myxococcales bacterium]|nr:DUF420 domain-containing protein [Myxococcales bacterium]MCB9708894.1 DUF420 domain-containing protein [Myxococcales bacterium]
MPTAPELAFLNACLNASAFGCMISGYLAIRRKSVLVHRGFMGMAFVLSVAFLMSYLTRNALYGETTFQGHGWVRGFYFFLLISHVLLSVTVVPLVLRTLYLAVRGDFIRHRRIAKITLPIWAYVSVTGVIVYLMLYRWYV